MLVNAQALINMARKRLCGKAHIETQKVMTAIKKEIAKVDADLAEFMVTDCEYRHGCHELRTCGYW
jgi:thymidylate synthase ThyX